MATIKVPIEVDITFVNKHWVSKRKQNNEKHYVIAFFQRGGNGRAKICALDDNNPETIFRAIDDNVKQGCTLYVEEGLLPDSVKNIFNVQELKEADGHSNGDLHVNNIKSLWRDLKRQIKREHVYVSKEHLQGYCNEVAWRRNHNHLSSAEKFSLLIGNIHSTPKLTYKKLIKRSQSKCALQPNIMS